MAIRFGILTVSDRCSTGEAVDKSGPALVDLLRTQKFESQLVEVRLVPDEKGQIETMLRDWSDQLHLDVILTTGGTGFAPRDVTPEATRAVLDREAPGLAMAMMKASLDITPMAMLSRAVCGVRGRTLIVNLPGSPKGAVENAAVALKGVPHAVALIRGEMKNVEKVHKKMNCGCSHSTEIGTGSSDISKVAHRPRKSPYPMVEVEWALQTIISEARSVEWKILELPIHEALGKIITGDPVSLCNIPPYAASTKDGYAVLTSDGAGERKVVGDVIAGDSLSGRTLQPGECVRITTGAPVCAGADAVVQVEDTELLESSEDGSKEVRIKILEAPTKGQDIRPEGSDLAKGSYVVEQLVQVGPAQIGALASAGLGSVRVFETPVVSVFSTGNEIKDVGSCAPGPGIIFDSNRPTLIALLKQQGFTVVDLGIARDDPEAIETTLRKAFSCSHVVISSGGVSMGEKDYLKHVLVDKLKATLHFGRVNMKPGKPTTFATFGSSPEKKFIFALPGNPVSATVTCHLFALPALRVLAGFDPADRREFTVRLGEQVDLDPRPEFCRAVLEREKAPSEQLPLAHLTGNQISSRLQSLQSGSVLLELPARTNERTVLEKGALVKAIAMV